MTDIPISRPKHTHLDIWERAARHAFAVHMGVSDERLRKAIRMVGSRITTLSSRLGI